MARKTKTVVIEAEGRDHGKHFVLTEMAAIPAEKWATRALLALTRANIEIPAGIEDMGFAGVALIGLRSLSGLQFAEAEPLLDEMMTCVRYMPDPGVPTMLRDPHAQDDIEEIATILKLRQEVFDLHVDFSKAVAQLKAEAAARKLASMNTSTSQGQ